MLVSPAPTNIKTPILLFANSVHFFFFARLYFQELLVIPWVIIETRRLQPKIATMIVDRETVLRVIKEAGGSTAV